MDRLDRRDLLAAAGLVGLTGLSGCLGYTVVDTDRADDRRQRILELEGRLASQQSQLESLEADVDRLRAERDDLRNERDALSETAERLRDRLRAPRLNLVAAVDGWERLGDVVHRGTDRVNGPTVTVAVSYTYPVHERGGSGNVAATERVSLATADGETVDETTRSFQLRLDPDQRLAESPLQLDTGSAGMGQYVATATVTDDVTGLTSEAWSVPFEIV